jgi:hypothetical protein
MSARGPQSQVTARPPAVPRPYLKPPNSVAHWMVRIEASAPRQVDMLCHSRLYSGGKSGSVRPPSAVMARLLRLYPTVVSHFFFSVCTILYSFNVVRRASNAYHLHTSRAATSHGWTSVGIRRSIHPSGELFWCSYDFLMSPLDKLSSGSATRTIQ